VVDTRDEMPERTGQQLALRVYTLGAFRVLLREKPVEDRDWRRKTARQLFKILLSRPNRSMTREEAIELLWPESDPEAASSNFRSTLHALRRALEPADIISSDRDRVWLSQDAALWVDADAFERAVDQARAAPDPPDALEQASALYGGTYLPDDVYEDWSTQRRDTLRRVWTDLQYQLAEHAAARSDIDAAARPLQRLLQADRCDERAAQELIRLFARFGRRSEALRTYRVHAEALRTDLGVEPARETQLLQRQIAAGETTEPAAQLSAFRCAYPFPAPRELIGREAELATLERVMAGGRTGGQAAVIGAPAGTGKSALVGKLVHRAQAQGVLCLAGGCYEERGAVPLGPFHDALVDFLLAQPAERIRAELGNSVEDLATFVPELRYHLKLEDGSSAGATSVDRMAVFGAIHSCLRTLADRGPVLVCLEDVHAADEATLQLFHYLARQTRRLPVVLMATYRTEEAGPNQPLAAILTALLRERLAVRISLDALGRQATDHMVAGLLSGSPSIALADSLYAITGGNPLFVEQQVMALLESGQLQQTGGLWHGTVELRRLPQIIRDAIAQRLRRLPRACADTLAMASVLGKSFEHRILAAAIEPVDEPTLLDNLDQALAANVLQETATGYAFRHALLREAVYWELSAPRRMLLHRLAGEVLERLYGEFADDHSDELAYHFRLAGASDDVHRKAFHYSMQAGGRAAQLSSYPQAILHFATACELLDQSGVAADSTQRLAALEGRARAERELARWPDSIRSYQQVLDEATTPTQRARARSMIAYGFQHTGDISRALDEVALGIAELADLPASEALDDRLYLNQVLGLCWYLQGRYHDLLRLGDQMLEDARGAANPRPMMLAHGVLAMGHMGLGQITPALAQQHLRLGDAEQTGDKVYLAIARENLGYQNYLGGHFGVAREDLEHALALYRDTASELRAVNALQHLCRVWVAEGQLARALEQTQAALELEVAGQERWAADGHQIVGSIHLLRSNWSAARSNIEAGLAIRERVGDRPGEVESTVSLGEIDEHLGEWQHAESRYRRALAVAEEMDSGPAAVQARRHLGHLLMLRGDRAGAEGELTRAMELATSIKETLEFGPTLQALAEWSLQDNDLPAALALAERSLTTPGPIEHLLAGHVLLASIYVELGNHPRALASATRAHALAQQVESVHWLSATHLAVARTTAPSGAVDAVTRAYEAAVQYADRAQTPLARARALNAYADYLRRRGLRTPDATAVAREADEILRRLR
jgi:DNA-binding SARP family transcriptional activator